MINWFRIFWQDLWSLPRWQSFCKYFLPALASFFTWGILGHLYAIQLETKSLIISSGQVETIGIKFEQGTKSIYKSYPLKISLDNYSQEFRVHDIFKDSFAKLENEIKVGDSITLYTRNKLQVIIGWGNQTDIYQIDKDGKTLFALKQMMNYQKKQGLIFGILAVLSWSFYLLYKRNTHKLARIGSN